MARESAPPPNSTESLAWRLEVTAFLVASVAAWYLTDLRYRVNLEFPLATFDAMVAGTANKPFQFRALVPWMIAPLVDLTGMAARSLFQMADAVFTLLIYYAFRYHLSAWFEKTAAAVWAFGIYLILPWHFILARDLPIIIVSDMSAVAFFTIGLVLVKRGWWAVYYPLFAIATLNREVTFLLILIFAIAWRRRMTQRMWLSHVAAQSAIWIAVKALMYSLYGGNPGTTLEYFHAGMDSPHWQSNLAMLIAPERLLTILSSFGFTWVLLLVFRRRITDPFIRTTLWIIPIHIALSIMFANINELRIYGELVPVVLTPVILILASLEEKRVAM